MEITMGLRRSTNAGVLFSLGERWWRRTGVQYLECDTKLDSKLDWTSNSAAPYSNGQELVLFPMEALLLQCLWHHDADLLLYESVTASAIFMFSSAGTVA